MAEMKRKNAQQKTTDNARHTSPNPRVEILQTLVGGGGISKPSDAPAPNKLSSPLRQVAEKITVPDTGGGGAASSEDVSPVSLGSFGTVESTGASSALTATANDIPTSGPHFVAEPAQMTDEPAAYNDSDRLGVADQGGNKAFSYPGPPPAATPEQPPQRPEPTRGMSLPGYGQSSPKSPASSNKRHKCPYCDTDFTRHHNLKSHLLTHSQEKPYVCPTCQSRFRRLHDLKRHTKLHTGERPHTCEKCGRRFARGDALARHNKGPGGCAGRRSSFGGDDDYGDGNEGMDGVEYTGGEDYDGSDDPSRRVSEPSRKRHQPDSLDDTTRQIYRQQSSTYPPPRNMRDGNMAPPSVVHPGANASNSPREASNHVSNANGSSYYGSGQVFAEPAMITQSPKPLSPGQAPDQHRLSVSEVVAPSGRNRATSLTTQYQQQHYGRGSTAGKTSPRMNTSYPPNASGPASAMLPPVSSSHPAPPRGSLPLSTLQQGHPAPPPSGTIGSGSNASSSLSSQSHGARSSASAGSMRDILASGPDSAGNDLWAYVRQLEARFDRMKNEYDVRISNLQEELRLVRAASTSSAPPPLPPPPSHLAANAPGAYSVPGPGGSEGGQGRF